jgi:hypothetical protein
MGDATTHAYASPSLERFTYLASIPFFTFSLTSLFAIFQSAQLIEDSERAGKRFLRFNDGALDVCVSLSLLLQLD